MNQARISPPDCNLQKKGGYVVYWMQQTQRVDANHALNEALRVANAAGKPLCAIFVLSDRIPEANMRHFRFMLEGLAKTAQKLNEHGIRLHLFAGDPVQMIPRITSGRALVVADRGYLHWQREWRRALKEELPTGMICEVESDVIVPVETASAKEEYSAATLRRKILRHLTDFLESEPLPAFELKKPAPLETPPDIPHLLFKPGMKGKEFIAFARENLDIDSGVPPTEFFKGGYDEAREHLDLFLERRLHLYAEKRNEPSLDIQSDLSPYLHFGQISALEIALKVLDYAGIPAYDAAGLIQDKSNLDPLQAGVASFLEELIIRRELSCNFCFYNEEYDNFKCVPLWARKTLNDHLHDARPYDYSLEELETGRTDDPFWNAAQQEMLKTGKMHNYMRMYWGKKLIEWIPEPETAFGLMLYLNNKYQLDGRDPNSYAGVAWCFGKHDRPWQERDIFGKVRYMNANGLKRKFDMPGYLEKVRGL
ncbi:MAG: deoxyribodipyrimidine photo-lyase [Candidatus Syntrophosphaera sp.]